MAPNIGVNLRVTGHCNQGDRRYMEDVFSVAYQQTEDEKDLEYAFFGIFDGHGGREAAQFAKENLMDLVVSQKNFWSDDDDLVLKAIREGFIATHQAMWKELERWPRTSAGLPSTSGSTASVAFIRRGKIYIGHVGDSAIILGYRRPDDDGRWHARSLTRDHKPESTEECTRIKLCGGKVINKSGVSRVVWNRPRIGHQGPIRRSTEIDEIPFLAVARSLGDLWSFNSSNNEYVVSPEPDLHVLPIDVTSHRCLVLGTDGMWNMVSPQWAIDNVAQSELFNEEWLVTHTNTGQERQWINPSKRLVDLALSKWKIKFLRADNTSVVTVMLDPPGPPKVQMMRKRLRQCSSSETSAAPCPADCSQPAKRRAVLEPAPDVASARFRPALFRSSQDGRVPPPPSASVRSPATVVPPSQRDYKVFNPVVSTLSRSDVHEMSSSPTIAAPLLTTTEPSIPAAADSDVENRAASPTSLLQRYRCRRSTPVRRRSSKAQDLISQQLLRLRSSLLTPPRTRRSALLHRRALRSHNGDAMVLPPLSCRNAR